PEDMAVTRFYTSCNILGALQRMHRTDVLLRKRIEQGRFFEGMKILEKMAADGIKFCGYNKIKASKVNCVDEDSRILPQGFDTVSTTGRIRGQAAPCKVTRLKVAEGREFRSA
ncbi:MAG: hypothetical protein RI910_1978, partial [Verrucomicrobiota bacterium]